MKHIAVSRDSLPTYQSCLIMDTGFNVAINKKLKCICKMKYVKKSIEIYQKDSCMKMFPFHSFSFIRLIFGFASLSRFIHFGWFVKLHRFFAVLLWHVYLSILTICLTSGRARAYQQMSVL